MHFKIKMSSNKKNYFIFCFYTILYLHVYIKWRWSHHLAQLFQLCECVLLSRHIALWVFHPASMVLFSSLTRNIWTCNQWAAEGGTADILQDALSFPYEAVAVAQIKTIPWSWAYWCKLLCISLFANFSNNLCCIKGQVKRQLGLLMQGKVSYFVARPFFSLIFFKVLLIVFDTFRFAPCFCMIFFCKPSSAFNSGSFLCSAS